MGTPSADSAFLIPHNSTPVNDRSLLILPGTSPLTPSPLPYTVCTHYLQLLETRSSVYDKLCKIHGKLGLMNIHEAESPVGVASEPLLSMTLGGKMLVGVA